MTRFRLLMLAWVAPVMAGCTSPAVSDVKPDIRGAEWQNPFPAALVPGSEDATAEERANIRVVLSFYQTGMNEQDADAAVAHVAEGFIAHDPGMTSGREGMRRYLAERATEYPQAHRDVKRVIADGDHVILHVHDVPEPEGLGNIVGDIYRLENGLIAEHWGITHALPENPDPDNPHGAFFGADDGSRRDISNRRGE